MEDFFDPAETVLVQAVSLQEQEVDDPRAAPFVDENPCLVCGHKAFANFIDLSYGTSCTSTTVMPVKKRLKEIVGRLWNPKQENQTLCLACYDLVDRFDSLESQLASIRENISDKYQRTSLKINGKTKGTLSNKKKGRNVGRTKKGLKKAKSEAESDADDPDDVTFTVEICDGNDSDYVPNDSDNHGEHDTTELQPVPPQFQIEPQEEAPNPNVYDEHHQLLQRGEKIRLGRGQQDENGVEAFLCGYCPQAWADISSLHNHVHGVHQPEVVDVAIPPELGLGNTMNCGVEIQNCMEPPENPKPWSCLFCDASFRARTNMSSHFKEKHTPYKPFSCSECGEAFRKGIDLNRHKLYFCPQRTVTFAPKRKYKKRDAKEKPSSKGRPRSADEDREEMSITVDLPVS